MADDTLEPGEEEYYGQNAEEDDDLVSEDGNNKPIIWLPKDHSLRELLMMKTEKNLDLQPQYQRNFVFDRHKASRLIESILMDVPIPAIYFAEEMDGKYSVIDGQQRLTSFLSFLEEKFPAGAGYTDFTLTGLELLKDLNKKKFSDLDQASQLKIRNTTLHTIVIKKESDEDVKFEIFERLNTGSVKLNEDELRNSVYRGPYIKLLSELEDNKDFCTMVNKVNYKNRMLYRGMILRFLALSEKSYLNYRPSMKVFCNKELREKRMLQPDKAAEYRSRFEKCVNLCFSVFGKNAYRRFRPGNESNPNGSWEDSRINMALFDVQKGGFVNYDHNQIINHANEIREAMMDLMVNNQDFIDSIMLKTSARSQMEIRFEKWLTVLKGIVSSSTPRTFSYEIKKQLFEEDPTCGICHNRIMAIEDAEVDHKVPYSQGGPTTIENAQLAHRYCNRHKSDKPA
jgi:hypothetical protein